MASKAACSFSSVEPALLDGVDALPELEQPPMHVAAAAASAVANIPHARLREGLAKISEPLVELLMLASLSEWFPDCLYCRRCGAEVGLAAKAVAHLANSRKSSCPTGAKRAVV